MKLLNKLTLFITLSKLLIVIFFVALLPTLVNRVSFQYTNYFLGQQKKKVLNVIDRNGIDYYLQGDSGYASYTMLKEEYISLVPAIRDNVRDTIEISRRVIEKDTLNYRILIHELKSDNKNYILEIGKTTSTIGEYNKLLQRFTLYILIGLILLSLVVDLLYTRILLRPLAKIVSTKLVNRKFPFKEPLSPIKTSTTDFKFLDSSLISLMVKMHEAFDKEREFTSNASHELMTPISVLQSNIENMMMEEGVNDEMQEKLLGLMKTVGRLKKIVHSLLYISRIENDQFARADKVEVHELSEQVMEELLVRLESKSIHFTNNVTPGITLLQVNRDLLFQLLYNLINNAIRYNNENGSIYLSDYYHHGKEYVLTIKDTGIGIRQEELAAIFNRFKKSGNEDGEGFGLGLSIVKSITDFHGIQISVQSVYGEGTTFNITLPESSIQKNEGFR